MLFIKNAILAGGLALGLAMPVSAFSQTAVSRDLATEEANRQLVVAFHDGVFNKHDIAGYIGVMVDDYRQHNPMLPDGKAVLVDYLIKFFADNPDSSARIVRSAADGDLVWLHLHTKLNKDDPGQASLDIFRVTDGKIVEHWDVNQPVPEKSANTNTMF